MKNSTNVRVLKMAMATLCRVAPQFAAHLLHRRSCTAPRLRATASQRAQLALARRFDFESEEGSLPVWSLGEGPAVILLHGWGGSAAHFSHLLQPLAEAGFQALAFDAPGHGESRVRLGSLPQFARAAAALTKAFSARTLIGHSLGAGALLWANSQGLDVDRIAVVAPPADVMPYFQSVAHRLSVPNEVFLRAIDLLEARIGVNPDALQAELIAPNVTAEIFGIHDRQDRQVLLSDAQRCFLPHHRGRLVTTSRLGHTRILRHPVVVSALVRFVSGESHQAIATDFERAFPRCQSCGNEPEPGALWCERCMVERHLAMPPLRWATA
jgi:pimeloyl-ACP methyl ester carboxylesterase